METERLIIRNFGIRDVEDVFEYSKDERVGPMAGWRPHRNKFETIRIVNALSMTGRSWAIYHKEDKKVIGSVGLSPDTRRDLAKEEGLSIGYVLAPEYWGKGYMQEACERILEYCFEDKYLEIVTVYHYHVNQQSKRVIEKLGFVFEGILRMGSRDYSGKLYHTYCYSMTKEEYLNRK